MTVEKSGREEERLDYTRGFIVEFKLIMPKYTFDISIYLDTFNANAKTLYEYTYSIDDVN